jgi:predicted SAM-dependent methyltransferase
MRLLNLGCGTTFHDAWVNVDIEPSAPGVIQADFRARLPFDDGEFDAVYHSHVLEHLPAEQGDAFLGECLRVLKRDGIIRVVVPDLEQIARLYLEKLNAAERGNSDLDYQWMMLELFDQTVRSRSGGEMVKYLQRADVENVDFIRSRIGAELDGIQHPPRPGSILERVRKRRLSELVAFARRQLTRSVVRVVGGRAALDALDEGRFRRSGEVHQWMYDGFSLRRALERAGARDVKRCSAHESRILEFASYQLDAIDGAARKPDSMYMEGLA